MRSFLHGLRVLVLGETWRLPLGVSVAVLVTAGLRLAAGTEEWFRDAGGWVLTAALAWALWGAVRPRRRA